MLFVTPLSFAEVLVDLLFFFSRTCLENDFPARQLIHSLPIASHCLTILYPRGPQLCRTARMHEAVSEAGFCPTLPNVDDWPFLLGLPPPQDSTIPPLPFPPTGTFIIRTTNFVTPPPPSLDTYFFPCSCVFFFSSISFPTFPCLRIFYFVEWHWVLGFAWGALQFLCQMLPSPSSLPPETPSSR